jgi:hypothetical protein
MVLSLSRYDTAWQVAAQLGTVVVVQQSIVVETKHLENLFSIFFLKNDLNWNRDDEAIYTVSSRPAYTTVKRIYI